MFDVIIHPRADTSWSFHTYSLEWTEYNLIFKFDGEITFVVELDRILQEGTYKKPGQPFDADFNLVLNCAVGGSFVEGINVDIVN